jgi:hypothetical protein
MTTFASRPIEPDWILFPGQVEIGGYRDPDMAHRAGVVNITPDLRQQRTRGIERRFRQTVNSLAQAWHRAVYHLAAAIMPTPKYCGV